MDNYNKCEGCKLWNGHHCTGAKSYEPNAEEHRIICNEHLARQFWVVFHKLQHSKIHIETLEEENKKFKNRISILEKDICNWQDYAIQKEQALDEIKDGIIEVLKGVF